MANDASTNAAIDPGAAAVVPYAVPCDAVLAAVDVDPEQGLADRQVDQRRARSGPNQLTEAPSTPAWRTFLQQFQELMVLLLVAAALVAGALGEWADCLAIVAIVAMNGIIGFLQEHRAEQALAALRHLATPMARVVRNGQLRSLAAQEIVPGDILQLEAGDHVPADCRLLQAYGVRTQEAALTGESLSVEKDPHVVLPADTSLGDRRNMVYLGTVVAAGKARAVVVATGMKTELGRIADLLSETKPEPTPLQRRLAELGRLLVGVVLVVIAIVFALHLLRGGDMLEVFLLSISLAVAAVPEGLPAVVTVALALGLQRMVRRNALIRRLPSVETLGSVTVICSDKTGTLTRNEMTVREVVTADASYLVTGTGYAPQGGFFRQPEGSRIDCQREPDLLQALAIGAWCNNAGVSPRPGGDDWEVFGDPTEGALLVAALKAGLPPRKDEGETIYEIPFDSDRKMMSVVVRQNDDSLVLYSKGAAEVILERCESEQCGGTIRPFTDARFAEVRRRSAEMAARALRVLAVAYRPCSQESAGTYAEDALVFAGLVGMMDPPRPEAAVAVQVCHDAGIRPVMITGDHPSTAIAIARELRIARPEDRVVTGNELDAMTDEQLASEVDRISVYARVAAEHKVRVVRAWKARGEVVAMTGDGVNDAPAVKRADIGIAMGEAGSDVTREASAMVLLDDNFASIVAAVEEGRTIYGNILKVIHYLLSSNLSEILLVFVAALLGWPAPLVAVQLLWINLVTDGLPALALSVEPPERDVMRRRPQPAREPVITWARGRRMFYHGTLMAAAGLLAFALVYRHDAANLPQARTVAFATLAFAQLLFAVSGRSPQFTLLELGPFSNPQLVAALAVSALLQLSVITLPFARPVFEVATALAPWEWAIIGGFALAPVTIIETVKLAKRWTTGKAA